MCGIVGHLRFASRVDPEALVVQRDRLVHRGPDSSGVWVSPDGRVGFGHRRLAIVDLSPAGHQPMLDPVTENCLCFNGEIYNFREIRSTLEGVGIRFRGHSDTEVILAAYAQWGLDFLDRLDGMFAFALYDARAERVVLARDRAGEKPLYIWHRPDGLAFSSELKALLADPGLERRANPDAVDEFLAYGYVTGSATLLRSVVRLPPAHYSVVELNQGRVSTHRYWDLPLPDAAASSDEASLSIELERHLGKAVGQQLVADVPVGVLLSGGIDSSLIASLAAEQSPSRIRTFTARFPDLPASDEGPHARLVADYLSSEHTELETSPADESLLHMLVDQFDEPIADSSCIPTFLLSREIRRHATVALGGDGGDELFGGYRHYPAQLAQARYRDRVPRGLGRAVAALASHIIPESAPGIGYLTALGATDGEIVAAGSRLFRRRARQVLLSAVKGTRVGDAERRHSHLADERRGVLATSMVSDFRSYMVDDVLVKVDRASMLTSLEVRAPFLSRAVIEFAFSSVPDGSRVSDGARKRVLRALARRRLPGSLDLHRKQGFDIPLDLWIGGAWRPLLRDLAGRRSALLDHNPLGQLLRRVGTRPIVGEQVYAIMVLLLWEARYGITW